MFDLPSIILGLTILFNLFLGGFVIFKNIRDKTNLVFGAFVSSIILWTLSMLMFRITNEPVSYMLWLRLSYVAAGFIGITFFTFCIFFIKGKLPSILWILMIITVIVMSIVLLQPWFLIHSIVLNSWGKSTIEEPLHHIIFSFYFIIFFFGALAIIANQYRKETGLEKTRLGYIVWGVLLAGSLGTLFNLILPSPWFNEWRFTWLGPVFTLIFVLFVALAITRYHLLNIRLIAVELFTVVILAIVGVQIFLSQNSAEFLLRTAIFLLLLLFGALLIRSALNEVRRREQLQELTRELREANKKLKKLDEAKSEFISIASHQLRTPLSIIKGYISMIMEGDYGRVDKKLADPMSKIYISNERLIHLVDSLLDISRIESGKMQYEFAPVQLEEIVEGIVDDLKMRTDDKGLYLKFIRPEKPLPRVRADGSKIHEITMNLIDNAIKYTERGGIVVSLESADNKITLCVADTGVGVTPEETKIIFQKFSRGDGGALVHAGGAGLGLFIAKKVITDHGGKIWLESHGRGKGSKFCFSLPIA